MGCSHQRTTGNPVRIMREAVAIPEWFVTHCGITSQRSLSPHVLLIDSAGDNMEDLLAAWCAVGANQLGAKVSVGDDQRDPDRVGAMIAKYFHLNPPDLVVGHFSSPVARQAAPYYADAKIPFFAPGSSADDLAQNSEQPIFQIFAHDSGQIELILDTIPADSPVMAVGETGNCGEVLLMKLRDRLGKRMSAHLDMLPSLAEYSLDEYTVVILGSKEFAAKTIAEITLASNPHLIILSDDSLGSQKVAVAASSLKCNVLITALKHDKHITQLAGFQVCELEAMATRTLKRAPGPYFLTACLGVTLALRAYQAGKRTPRDVRTYLRHLPIVTPYGNLTVSSNGTFTGFTWITSRLR